MKRFYFILESVPCGNDRSKFGSEGIGAFDGTSVFGRLLVEDGFLSRLY